METATDWAIALAEVAAPDEVDLAPDFLDAYIAGGKTRASLFRQEGTSVSGAFGPGNLVVLLPWLLKAIASVARGICELLASEELGNVVSVVKDGVELGEKVNGKSPKQALQNLPEQSPYQSLKRVLDVMGDELRQAGLSDDQADLISFRVLDRLLEDPASAEAFVHHLEKSQ